MFDPGGIDGGVASGEDGVRLMQAVQTGAALLTGRNGLTGLRRGCRRALQDEHHPIAVKGASVVQA